MPFNDKLGEMMDGLHYTIEPPASNQSTEFTIKVEPSNFNKELIKALFLETIGELKDLYLENYKYRLLYGEIPLDDLGGVDTLKAMEKWEKVRAKIGGQGCLII